MRSISCRTVLEGDNASGAELDEIDDEDDHVCLGSQRVRRVQSFDPLLQGADHTRAQKRPPDIANTAHDHGHEALDDIITAKL